MLNVDRIYVITLKDAYKRREQMKKWYKNVNLNFFIIDKMKNPEKGCFTSHQKVIIDAKKKGYKRILVLEDDAYPLYNWEYISKKSNDAMNMNEWDYIMLGYLPIRAKKINDNIVSIKCALDAHAYIVNIERVKSIPWKGDAIDHKLFCNNENIVYGIHPMLIVQKAEKSQIRDIHLFIHESIPKLFGGLENMTNVACSINLLILPIIIILLILSIILILTGYVWISLVFFVLLLLCIILGLLI